MRSFYDSNGDDIGDLQGVLQKLDYLSDDLGVTAIWLMPIFASPSYHGYDITDYYTVNPDYGTNADFANLVEEVHRWGMRIIIDYVIGHTSNQHPFFRDAYGHPNSKYADWYIFTNDDYTAYKSFLGLKELPSLNQENPAVQKYVLDVARYWMDLDGDGDYTDGIDGLRCDFALGVPHEMWKRIRRELKALNPNLLLLGEVWTRDTQELAAFYDEEFDSTFDFPLYHTLAGDHDKVGDGVLGGTNSPSLMEISLLRREQLYPTGAQSVIFINNHDTNRVLSNVGGDLRRAKQGAVLLLTLLGTPMIYYGEEIGMKGVKGHGDPYWDEFRREPMDWYAAEKGPGMTTWFKPPERYNRAHDGISVEEQRGVAGSLFEHYRSLIALRNAYSALYAGTWEKVLVTKGGKQVYAYLRQNAAAHIVVALNFSASPVEAALDFSKTTLPSGHYAVTDLLTEEELAGMEGGTYSLTLEPYDAYVLLLMLR